MSESGLCGVQTFNNARRSRQAVQGTHERFPKFVRTFSKMLFERMFGQEAFDRIVASEHSVNLPGKLLECSTEFTPMIEFCAQTSTGKVSGPVLRSVCRKRCKFGGWLAVVWKREVIS